MMHSLFRSPSNPLAVAACLLLVLTSVGRADEADYSLNDRDLKLVRIDSAEDESFFSVRGDGVGRIFVGGRRSLFVYEPDDRGGYQPRRLLYRFPEHTWVNDIAVRGDDLYLLTVSALYVMPGGVTRREGLEVRRLVWGVPLGHVHQCFHALAWGPEGDLYLSMGDPVVSYGDFSRPDHWCHWTFFSQPNDTPTSYTGVGGVFRCRPDGSRFQVVARGMRNACGLAFDRHWNLFSNDNDHESIPDLYVPGRLLHVTPRAEFFWPRGWMVEKTPDRRDLLDTLFAGMGRAVPVGQACYGDDFLPPMYRDNLLVARWCNRSVSRYPLRRRGASFQADEHVLLACRNDARPVGVCVARGGRIFATVAHMAHNEGSPVYKSDLVMITRRDDPASQRFTPIDLVQANADQLWSELSDPSWSRRSAAHVELLRRSGEALSEAPRRLAAAKEGDLGRVHFVWLAAAASGHDAVRDLSRLAKGKRPEVRLQAVRALAEFAAKQTPREVFVSALADSDPQVQHAALVALFALDGPVPDEVLKGPARSMDSYLRQTAALLLAERASAEPLDSLCNSADAAGRLAGVLAVGFRLTVPPATRPIPAELPLAGLANDEQYVIQFADAKIDLREHGRIGNFTIAEHWRAGGHSAEQEQLFQRLVESMRTDRDETVRLQAAFFLRLLNDARSEPAIAKVIRESEERRLAVAPLKGVGRVWLAGPFSDHGRGFREVHPPEAGPIDLSAVYTNDGANVAWKELENATHCDLYRKFGRCDDASFYAYFRVESVRPERMRLMVGSDDGVKVWHNGREVWANPSERAALPLADVVTIDLVPGANDVLVRVQNHTGECGFYLHYRALGNVGVRLPEKPGADSLAERLKAAAGQSGAEISAEFLEVDWSRAVAEAKPTEGRRLFEKLGCVKCHATGAQAAATGGPSLADAAKRFTLAYLVESVLAPSKQVSPLFRRTSIETESGQTLIGLVVSESSDGLELLQPDGTRRDLAKNDVSRREVQELSPMPAGIVKTPAELSHLLAYLLRGE